MNLKILFTLMLCVELEKKSVAFIAFAYVLACNTPMCHMLIIRDDGMQWNESVLSMFRTIVVLLYVYIVRAEMMILISLYLTYCFWFVGGWVDSVVGDWKMTITNPKD